MIARLADREIGGVPVRVHYPVGASGRLPVMVFSHGVGGSRLGYGYLGRCWAAHGFVTVHPSHRERFHAAVHGLENAPPEVRAAMNASIADPASWQQRPRDVARVIDELGTLQNLIPTLEGRIDGSRIGIAGHSYGAYTTLLCAGARVALAGAEKDFGETRARAFVALSPPGNGPRGLSERSWETIQRPVLVVTGTLDAGVQGEPPEWREDCFRGMPAGDKTLVVVAGANHAAFAGGQPRKPVSRQILHDVEASTLWFWNRYLNGVDAPFPAPQGARVEHR